MFFYEFMQRAFAAATLIGVMAPILGVLLILRRQSLLADTLSHVSLVGVALGLLVGVDPTWTTLLVVVLAALLIEGIASLFKGYTEVSIAILMAGGLALALFMMSFQSGQTTVSINQFLFGSIVAISENQLWVLLVLTVVVASAYVLFRRPLFVLIFDPDTAHTAGLPVKLMSTIFTVITGAVISVMLPIAGALLVSAIIVLPSALALRVSKTFTTVFIVGIITSLVGMYIGLIGSYQLGTPPGATITLTLVALFSLTVLIQAIKKRLRKKDIVTDKTSFLEK